MENGFVFVILIGIVLASVLFRLIDKESKRTFQDENDNDTAEQTTNSKTQNDAQPDTFGLMFNTLCNIGCQPSKNDDGTLSVQYQGENFLMHFGGMYAHIWYPMWAGIKADDPDLPQIREAVNIANFNFGPTTVMSAPDENGIIGFHSHRGIMLHPTCPDNDRFVSAVLDSFFEAKQEVRNSYHKLNIQQTETRRNRRPVGFSTPTNPETPPTQNDN